MLPRHILAVMDPRDTHHDPVVSRLLSYGAKVTTVDLSIIPTATELSFRYGDDPATSYDDKELTNVTAVWWRQPIDSFVERMPLGQINPRYHDYASSAVRQHASTFVGSFQTTENIRWLSNPDAMVRADNKHLQLLLASRLGMAVPRTMQTSSSDVAAQFIADEQNRGNICVVKTMSRECPIDEAGNWQIMWTTKLPDGYIPKGLSIAPSIFQQYVEGFDVTAAIVGDAVFAARITVRSSSDSHISDWRIRNGLNDPDVTIEPYVLPQRVEQACIRMLRRLGIDYGRFDFKVDSDGVHWFFEVNSNGAWNFVEHATGQPISEAVAKRLMMKT